MQSTQFCRLLVNSWLKLVRMVGNGTRWSAGNQIFRSGYIRWADNDDGLHFFLTGSQDMIHKKNLYIYIQVYMHMISWWWWRWWWRWWWWWWRRRRWWWWCLDAFILTLIFRSRNPELHIHGQECRHGVLRRFRSDSSIFRIPSNLKMQCQTTRSEYRTKLGMTKVVLRGSWGYHHCKTDRGPP